jgi:hypothetical protein
MKKCKAIFIFSCIAMSTFGQNLANKKPLQNIRGLVFDIQAKTALHGTTIVVAGGGPAIKTISDAEGKFVLEGLPIGRYALTFSHIGYQTTLMDNILVGAGKETAIEIGLPEDVTTMKAVVISAYKNNVMPINKMTTVSARSISAEETKRYAGSLSDPSRMALSYAGVANGNGYNNGIVIRGNSPKGLLWRLEGIEIPNPNHLAVEGSSSGLINILNSNNMARSDFFISAFPAEYGNAYSGIFDLKMRNGNENKREYSAEAGIMGFSGSAEGPLNKKNKGSYLVNYRYSTFGLLIKLGNELQGPDFQDMTFKLKLPTKRFGTFSIFGLGGLGKWLEDEDVSIIDSIRQTERLYTAKNLQHYNVGIMGISNKFSVNDKTVIETVVAASAAQNRPVSSGFNYDSSAFNIVKTYIKERGTYLNSSYRLTSTLTHKFNGKLILNIGVKLNYLSFSLKSESGLPNGVFTKNLEKKGSANLSQAFIAWQIRTANRWVINTGVHFTHFSLGKELLTEPRFGVRKEFNDKRSISLGAGLHSRYEHLSAYYGEIENNGMIMQPNKNLKLNRAAHFVLGYDETLSKNLHLKIEVYYQHLFNIPVEDSINSSYSSLNEDLSFTPKTLTNKGAGRNYGAEVTIEKHYSKQYYYLVTASIFDSKYKTLENKWRDTRYNINYVVNLIGGKEFTIGKGSKNRVIGFNIRGSVTGGKRATPVDLHKSIAAGYEVQIKELLYSKKLKEYYRLDFSTYLKWDRKKTSHEIKIDILNLIEQNVIGIRYVPSKYGAPAYVKEYSFNEDDEATSNLLPIVGYRINF